MQKCMTLDSTFALLHTSALCRKSSTAIKRPDCRLHRIILLIVGILASCSVLFGRFTMF